MSEDINIRIKSDESGAIAGFKRLRNEILNNEKGIKEIGSQGRLSGKALKDMASFLGPEFQILGDRIDHVSGALEDMKGAGLLAKASLVGLVATAGVQVGQMIGGWIFETERWTQELEDAKQLADQLNSSVARGVQARASEMSPEQLQREMVGLAESIQRQTRMVEESEKAWSNFSTADYWVIGESNRRKEVEGIKENIKAQKDLMKIYQDAMKQQAQRTRQEEEASAARALEEQARAAEKALQAEKSLEDAQATYLENLKLEIVRVKEGEEAYQRLLLAKQNFTEETIDSAIALQNELKSLRSLQDKKPEVKREQRQPELQQLQANQQRFITRGSGMKIEEKQLKESEKMVAGVMQLSQKFTQMIRLLGKLPTEVTE